MCCNPVEQRDVWKRLPLTKPGKAMLEVSARYFKHGFLSEVILSSPQQPGGSGEQSWISTCHTGDSSSHRSAPLTDFQMYHCHCTKKQDPPQCGSFCLLKNCAKHKTVSFLDDESRVWGFFSRFQCWVPYGTSWFLIHSIALVMALIIKYVLLLFSKKC